MPFLLIETHQNEHMEVGLSVVAKSWHRGQVGLSHKIEFNPDSHEGNKGAESVAPNPSPTDWVPLLRLADGCFAAGPATVEDIQAISMQCEEDGYHLPLQDGRLEVSVLEQILTSYDDSYTKAHDDTHMESSSAMSSIDAVSNRLTELFNRACELPYVTLQHLTALAGTLTPALAEFFAEAADVRFTLHGQSLPDKVEVVHQLAFTRPLREEGATKSPDESDAGALTSPERGAEPATPSPPTSLAHAPSVNPRNLLQDGSPLEQRLPGFQVRPGQLQMVEAVSDALQNAHHLMVEAGTGTGKSLAYLIPAVLHAKENDERVIVSTHTIALQDQIANRDFPLLQNALGESVSLTVFKGRTHYVCMRKLHQEVQTVSLVTLEDETIAYMRLLVWLTETEQGGREELPGQGAMQMIWPRIQSETETCIHKRCPFFRPCYYFRARAKAYEADVVVTNHSLVFTDLKTDHRVLPRYSRLVFDEAHHIEEEATKHLGEEVHRFGLLGLFGRISRDGGRHGVIGDLLAKLAGSVTTSVRIVPILEKISEELNALRSLCEQSFNGLAGLVPSGQSDLRIRQELKDTRDFQAMMHLCDEIDERLTKIRTLTDDVNERAEQETDEELAGRMLDAAGYLQELAFRAGILASLGNAPENWVEWIEVSGPVDRRQVSLRRAPIDVSGILRDRLFEPKESVILTSATLSVGGDFTHLARRLGLRLERSTNKEEESFSVQELTVPSPFDYNNQALLCVPNDIPDLSKMKAEEAAVWLSDSIYQLARISNGRLLALFTSHAMLRATANYIRDALQKEDIRVLAQGIDGNRTQLLRMFQDHPKSVLLGAQSFWEGIDLPGDQLTTLVIVRLPFAPPTHPVTEARSERMERAGLSSFWHQSLPDAIVRFRQGFGRLVRTVNDKGVVVVFDKRIITSKYGTQFRNSVEGLQTYVGTEREVLRKVKTFLS